MKFIGAAIILIGSVIAAYFYEKGIRERLRHTEEIISFITYVKSQIEYFSRPLNEIYSSYEKKSNYITELIKNNGENASISKENDVLVKNFFSLIGKSYKKEEIRLCNYTVEQLFTSLTHFKLEIPNKIKIFRSISLFLGVCLIILII